MLQVLTHLIWERWRSQRGGNGILAKTWRWRKNQPDKKELYWVEKALLGFKSVFGYISIPFDIQELFAHKAEQMANAQNGRDSWFDKTYLQLYDKLMA